MELSFITQQLQGLSILNDSSSELNKIILKLYQAAEEGQTHLIYTEHNRSTTIELVNILQHQFPDTVIKSEPLTGNILIDWS